MNTRSTARKIVRPVVGRQNWQHLHDVKVGIKDAQARRAERAAAAAQSTAEGSPAGRSAAQWAATTADLTALAKHFATDKWGNHYYTPHYQRHFEHLREEPVRVLEIGIGGYQRDGDGGASLRMWKHFFPQGQIVGLDIEDKSFVEEERIKVYQGDQSDPDLLKQIDADYGPFNIIIDDGSHRPEHVIASFEVLYPLLRDDGIYAIEDTHTSYWPHWGGSLDREDPATSLAMVKRLTDCVNYEEFLDDDYQPTYFDQHIVGVHCYHNLVFIDKGTNQEGARLAARTRERLRATRAAEAAKAAAGATAESG